MPSQTNVPAGAPSEPKPHAGAVETAMHWLGERHRKGWKVSFERLRDELLTVTEQNKLSRLDPQTLSAVQINLTEWLLCEGEIQVQGTMRLIPDYLVSPAGPNWTPGQRDWLTQLAQRPLRLYQVTDVVPDQQMTLCDILKADAEPIIVRERSGTRGLTPGTTLACRPMREGAHFVLSGSVCGFSMLTGPMVSDQVRAIAHDLGDSPASIRAQSMAVIKAWLQQFVAPQPMPQVMDHFSGEPLVPITDHYRVLDWDALCTALQACADVEGDRDEGWSRTMDCPDGQIRALADIGCGDAKDHIEVSYRTQTYADKGQIWMAAVAAGSVDFLKREQSTLQEALEKIKRQAGRKPAQSTATQAAKGTNASSLSSAQMTQAITDVLHRVYADWPDTAVPALQNKTPRQAITSSAGLERVKGLLRSYEANELAQAKQQSREPVSYDFLWQSIGVAR